MQYGDLQRIGDDRSLKVNVRIIAATNKDLKQEVIDGRFRADLYHRLSVFPLHVAPLRERGDDIALLAGYFIEKCRAKLGIQTLRLSQSSLTMLSQYSWPGNIRELEHCIHRAAILARSEHGAETPQIRPHHFNFDGIAQEDISQEATITGSVRGGSVRSTRPVFTGESLRDATELFQAQYIQQALDANSNNWAATARQLGIDSGNLHRLAKRLRLK